MENIISGEEEYAPPAMLAWMDERSRSQAAGSSTAHKADWGQYFTPSEVAWFMAGLLPQPPIGAHLRILDPGAGAGVLGAAAALRALAAGARSVEVTAVEAEPGAVAALHSAGHRLTQATGGRARIEIIADDFLLASSPRLGSTPLPNRFDYVIANPPYFKLSPKSGAGGTAPNAYARFMEVSAGLLRDGGTMCFIVPRSFTSGLYFKRFRAALRERMMLQRVHIFQSRRDAFRDDEVLQENVITLHQRRACRGEPVEVSTSAGVRQLKSCRPIQVSRSIVEDLHEDGSPVRDAPIRLPATAAEVEIVAQVLQWSDRLNTLGLKISTGPIVPFRSDALRSDDEISQNAAQATLPVLWMQHIKVGQVVWPLERFRKQQHIHTSCDPKLLVPNRTMILLRRFSTKDEHQRLVAALYREGTIKADSLGLENHVNYIHSPAGSTTDAVMAGLCALLCTPLADTYFRIANGNTQVNATDLETFPLPSAATLERIGLPALHADPTWWSDGQAVRAVADAALNGRSPLEQER